MSNVLDIRPATAQDHDDLRREFSEYARSCGFVYGDFGIEHRTDTAALRVLTRIQDNTALYLRGSPDAWIAHEHIGLAIQVEFKSRQSKYENMALEAQPLASAIQRSKPPLNIRVLYVYRDSVLGQDAGFWCEAPPRIARVYLGQKDAGIHRYVQRCFADVEIRSADDNDGSRDSFALVLRSDWTRLPHWKDLLSQETLGF